MLKTRRPAPGLWPNCLCDCSFPFFWPPYSAAGRGGKGGSSLCTFRAAALGALASPRGPAGKRTARLLERWWAPPRLCRLARLGQARTARCSGRCRRAWKISWRKTQPYAVASTAKLDGRMRRNSLWGLETWKGCTDMGAVGACERNRWGLRWSSLCGHEACEGCAGIGAVGACERTHWGLRWSPLRGRETW